MVEYEVDTQGVSAVARRVKACEPAATGAVGQLLARYDAAAEVVKHGGVADGLRRYRDRYEKPNLNLPKEITRLAQNTGRGAATMARSETEATGEQQRQTVQPGQQLSQQQATPPQAG